MADLPRANIEEIEKRVIGNGADFSAVVGRFTEVLGMRQLGCSVVELAPGEKGWPFHLHWGEEELFVVLEGQGSMRYGDDSHEIGAGDVLFTPPGEGTAHQIINTSGAPLKYLALSTHSDPAVCYYPDSDKYASSTRRPDGNWDTFIAPASSEVDYYHGEGESS